MKTCHMPQHAHKASLMLPLTSPKSCQHIYLLPASTEALVLGPVQAGLCTQVFQAVQVQHSTTDDTAVQLSIWVKVASNMKVFRAVC